MFAGIKSIVAGVTAFAILFGSAAANLSNASAASDAPKTVVDMSTTERVIHLGAGAGLIGGGIAAGTVGLTGLYLGIAAVGIGAAAAPLVVGAILVSAIGFGVYQLARGIIGKNEVSGTAVARNAATASPSNISSTGSRNVSPSGSASHGVGIRH